MIVVYLAFFFYSGIHFTKSEDPELDLSSIELRLLLSVTNKVENPSELRWRDWNIVYVHCSLREGLELFQMPQYVRYQPTVIFIHGLRGDAVQHSLPMIAMLRHGYKERFNLVSLNIPYFKFSSTPPWYKDPALYTKLLGEEIGKLLVKAEEEDLIDKGQIHLVGFSLGAQCSGFIARTAPRIVATIVGLDPAGPGFNSRWGKPLQLTHISKSDAPVVHLYHTNSKTLGTTRRDATVDVVFNNGWLQPGCQRSRIILCSHKRAIHLFAEMIRRPGAFIARRCNSHKEFMSCQNHDNDDILVLTFPPEPEANGNFYLTTANAYPFGKGRDGIFVEKEETSYTIISNPGVLVKLKRITPYIEKYIPDYTTVENLKSYIPNWFPFKNSVFAESTSQKKAEFDYSRGNHEKANKGKKNQMLYRTTPQKHTNPSRLSNLKTNIYPRKDQSSSETETKKHSDYEKEEAQFRKENMIQQLFEETSSE